MPLVRVALRKGKSPQYRRAVSDSIHRAMVETIKVPEPDKFQIITEHDDSGLIYDPSYLGISRSDDVLLIQITLNTGRTLEAKKAFYARLVQLLRESPGVRPEDVLVNLVEVAKEDWSFGNGIAQYAT
jgi:4-oxalocrotonate tautomerase